MSDTRTAHGLTMDFFFQVTDMPELKKVKEKSFKLTVSKLGTERAQSGHKGTLVVPALQHSGGRGRKL